MIRYLNLQAAPTIDTINVLIDAFIAVGSIDNEGVGEALDVLLVQAQAKMHSPPSAAKNILNAFIRLVETQSDKHITTEAAQALIDSARAVINSL